MSRVVWYQCCMVLLAFLSVGMLVFELTRELAPEQSRLLSIADIVIACLFLTDFVGGLIRSDNRATFFRQRWYELFACIPLTNEMVQSLRGLRIVRIVPLIRIIRVIRATSRIKRISSLAIHGPREQLLQIALTSTTLVFAAAIAFFTCEKGVNPNVKTLFDALWWAVVTVTSTGYGDIFPVTVEGRIIAMTLMVIGIGTLGIAMTTIGGALIQAKKEENPH